MNSARVLTRPVYILNDTEPSEIEKPAQLPKSKWSDFSLWLICFDWEICNSNRIAKTARMQISAAFTHLNHNNGAITLC
ncbi:MAG: hypothetical protein GY707_09525 [Desulfobacteraceae bacterium]|nr:hypothetical protein [Desulfobacteraceae bacterium]